MPELRPQFVKSARRVFEVLEYFDRDRPAASVTDISRALAYPQSSTSVLLKCMRQLGYLYYNRQERTYRPTARVALLGAWVDEGGYRGGKVLNAIDRIAERVGETVVLSSAGIDYAVHHLHIVRADSDRAVVAHVGQSEPLLHSPQGLLLLASYPDAQIRLAIHRVNAEQENQDLRVNVATKLKELQQLRQQGWIIDPNCHADDGVGAVALLLPRRKGGDRLVLSVFAKREVIEERGEEFLRMMIEERNYLNPSSMQRAALNIEVEDAPAAQPNH
jgi:DNA-binding IclR family transcriptional regulator